MKKHYTNLPRLAARLVELISKDAYSAGEGFEYLIIEQDISDCVDRMPLPDGLKQVRGAIYQAKGRQPVKDHALWLVTNRASLSPRLSDEVALYILSANPDDRILANLSQRMELSENVRSQIGKPT